MKLLSFLADENVSLDLVKVLRDRGYQVLWIRNSDFRGISDEEIVDLAIHNDQIILTHDRGF